jgi:hypothetical protein
VAGVAIYGAGLDSFVEKCGTGARVGESSTRSVEQVISARPKGLIGVCVAQRSEMIRLEGTHKLLDNDVNATNRFVHESHGGKMLAC